MAGTSIKDILVKVRGDSKDLVASIEAADDVLRKFDGSEYEAIASLDTDQLLVDLAEAQAVIEAVLDDETVEISAKVDKDSLRVAREAFIDAQGEISEALKQQRSDMGTFLPWDRNTLRGALREAAHDIGEVADEFDFLTKSTDRFKLFDDFSLTLSRVYPQLVGIAIIIGVSLVGALASLAASLAAAAGGFVSLGSAVAAAFGPAMLVALGVLTRLADVLKVFQDRQNAAVSEEQQAIKAADAHAAAARRNAAAQDALSDAVRNLQRAERDLADARDAARETLRQYAQSAQDGHQRTVEAVRDEREAVRDLREARVEAARAEVDALERVQDAYISLADNRQDVAERTNSLNKAQSALNALLNQLPSDKLGDVLQKLNDVNLDPEAARQFIQAAAGPGSDPRLAQKIVDAQLAVQRAKIELAKANDRVGDSQREINRAQEDYNQYLKHGLAAHDGYRAALERSHDASKAVARARREEADAERKLAKARREGIDGMRSVIAASDRVADARRAVAKAERGVRDALAESKREIDGITSATAKARAEWKLLSKEERGFVLALEAVVKIFRNVLQPTTDAFFSLFADGAKSFGQLMRNARKPLNSLGQAMVDAAQMGLRELKRPEWRLFFVQSINLAKDLIKQLAPATRSIARLFLAIASNVDVQDAIRDIARGIRRFARELEQISQTSEFAEFMALMVDSLKAWLGLLRPLGKLLVGFLRAAAPAGNELLRWISGIVDKFADWMNSAEGQKEVKQFFADVIPLAKSVLKLLAAFLHFFLRGMQLFSPFLEGLLDGLSAMFNGFAKLMDVINDVAHALGLRGALKALGTFVSFFVGSRGIAAVVGLFGRLLRVVSGLPLTFAKIFGRAAARVGIFVRDVGQFLINGATRIGRVAFAAFAALGANLLGWVVDGITGAGRAVEGGAKWLADMFLKAVKGMVAVVRSVGTWIIDRVVAAVRTAARAVLDVGGWIIDKIVEGALAVGGFGAEFGKTVGGWLLDGLKSMGDIGSEVVKWLRDKIGDAISGGASVAASLGSWLLGGLKTVGDIGGDVVGWVRGRIAAAIDAGAAVVEKLGTWLFDGIKSLADPGKTIVAWVRDRIASAIDAGAAVVEKLGTWILDGLRSLGELGSRVLNWLRDKIGDAIDGGAAVAAKLAGWLWNGLTALADIGVRIARWLKKKLQQGFNAFKEAGVYLANRIWEGLKRVGSWLKEAILDAVKSIPKDLWNKVKDVANKAKGSSVSPGQQPTQISLGDAVAFGVDFNDTRAMHEAGQSLGAAIADGVRTGIRDARGLIRTALRSALLDHNWTGVGNQIASAIVLGIAGMQPFIKAIVAQSITSALGQVKVTASGIKLTPSRQAHARSADAGNITQIFNVEAPATGGQPDVRAALAALAVEAKARGHSMAPA